MRAILLAAGRGLRLQQPADQQLPKCLLRFGGMSLLERHARILARAGVHEVTLALGFRHDIVASELKRLGWHPELTINDRFELGSVLTVHTAAGSLTRGGDVLLMDADVLYDEAIMTRLVAGPPPVNRLLIDRNFEAGDEPVKVLVRRGVPLELRKQPTPGIEHDVIGESVGFFRLSEAAARRLAELTAAYVASERAHLPHEEALRDLIQERSQPFEVADVTGIPWIEIDYAEDVKRAEHEVLPRIAALPAS